MILLAVSGGPDSMFMLDQYKNKKIVVAHVNYHMRKSANRDEKIVSDFCNKNNIPFFKKDVKYPGKGNFENWARKERYNFFKEVYENNSCKKLLVAHHMDDFLETALMQQSSGRTPKFFGINKKIIKDGMNIERPYINLYWKDEIQKIVSKRKIPFGIDETNLDPSYSTRNKIRNEISKWSPKEKRDRYKWFKMSNKILKKRNERVAFRFNRWSKTDFSTKFFKTLDKYKEEIVFEYLNEKFKDIKISSKKIKSIIDFIESPTGNVKYKLNDSNYILKENGKIKELGD